MVHARKDFLEKKTVVQLRGIAKAIGNNKIQITKNNFIHKFTDYHKYIQFLLL